MLYRFAGCLSILILGMLLSGCSTNRATDTKRGAIEQRLVAGVIERGVGEARFDGYRGKRILMEYDYLATQVDKEFLQGYVEMHLARCGVSVVRDVKQADYIMQVICGVLATDYDRLLLGTPSLPIPVPDTTLSIVIPELSLFEVRRRTAYGRFGFNVLNAADRSPHHHINGITAMTKYIDWTVLFIPFKSDNIGFGKTVHGNDNYSF